MRLDSKIHTFFIDPKLGSVKIIYLSLKAACITKGVLMYPVCLQDASDESLGCSVDDIFHAISLKNLGS